MDNGKDEYLSCSHECPFSSCGGNSASTSEIAGPAKQVNGTTEYKISENSITLSGFAFYGGDATSSGSDTTALNMFIRKDEIGLNKRSYNNNIVIPVYCLCGISRGTFSGAFNPSGIPLIVTMEDYDLLYVRLTFFAPSATLRTSRTFSYKIQHEIHKCKTPTVEGYNTEIQQFGALFLFNINRVAQDFSVAVGPESTIIMTNSTVEVRQKDCPFGTLDKIYTQDPFKRSFWETFPDVIDQRPTTHYILYDMSSKAFVIAQIRELIQPVSVDIFSSSDILFAVSKTANPTLDDNDWHKFSFGLRTVVGFNDFNHTIGLQLSYSKGAYYIVDKYSIRTVTPDSTIIIRGERVLGIKKSDITCDKSIDPVELINLPVESNDPSRLMLPQMLTPKNYIYAIDYLGDKPFVVYKISFKKIRSRILPIILNNLGRGTGVVKDNKLWFSYEVNIPSFNSHILWYEINILTLNVTKSEVVFAPDSLRLPAIMVDAYENMFIALQIIKDNIWSAGYTFKYSQDLLTHGIKMIRHGTQIMENGFQTLRPWISLDPYSETLIYAHAGYIPRKGNWNSFVFTLEI